MKSNYLKHICSSVLLALLMNYSGIAQDIRGKITVGYQGWFACPNDGSPINMWWHWTTNWGQAPSPTNKGMVSWPDMSAYESVYNTAFSNLGNGDPATVFSSYNQQTVDTQFAWMAQNGIHCAALQRFSPFGGEGPTRDGMAAKVKIAAEKKGVKFYIMYDVSGWGSNMQTQIKEDWTNKMSLYASSPAYAKEDGKPVVVIWGFGFNDNNHNFSAEVCLDVINWFKAQGCYVGGGVPTHWRDETSDSRPGFIDVYHAFDMLSPWMVGRIGSIAGSDDFYTNDNVPDVIDCNAHGIDYQPCVLPGDLQAGHRANGAFMWRQFYNMKRAGSHAIYISMYDEYNESNQIVNTADSYLSIPTNYPFRTTSSGGKYISSDFYMRLTNEGGKMLSGEIPLSETFSTVFQAAPIWFRSSFEQGFDAQLTWGNTVANPSSLNNIGNLVCDSSDGKAYVGKWSLMIGGEDNSSSTSFVTFKAIDVAVDVVSNTNLTFLTYPENDLGRYVSIDLLLNDSTKLSDVAALDYSGISMDPSVGRGDIQKWNKTTCNIGQWLNGKSIDKILITYNHPEETGSFTSYIDNLSIYNGEPDTTELLPSFPYNPSPSDKEECEKLPAKLQWESVDYGQQYKVYLSTNSNIKESNLIATLDTVGMVKVLNYKTTYYWRVDQVTAAGTTMGPVWEFTTPQPYPAVTNPSPINGITELDTALTFKWKGEQLGQSFKFYLSDKTPLTSLDLWAIQSDTAFMVTGLEYSTKYYWKIDQTGPNGTREGEVWTFSTKMFPQQATNPRPANNATDRDTNLTIYWDGGLYSDSHNIYFGTSNTLTESDLKSTQGRLSYKLSGLDLGTTYYWRIDEVNEVGTTPGTIWKFTTKQPSSVFTKSSKKLKLYPNPVTDGFVSIDFTSIDLTDNSRVIIRNMQGQEVKRISLTNNGSQKIDVRDLTKGIYLIQVQANDEVFGTKIIIE